MLTLYNLASLLASFFSVAVKAAPGLPDVGTVFSIYPGWYMDNGGLTTIFGGTEQDCLKTCIARGLNLRRVRLRPFSNNNNAPFCVPNGSIDLTTFKTQTFDVSLRTGWTHALFHCRCTGVTQVAAHIIRPKDSLSWVVVVAYLEEILLAAMNDLVPLDGFRFKLSHDLRLSTCQLRGSIHWHWQSANQC
ncbi:hypothetical protein B0H14DRAFT_2619391 [Mycena olivaceomarginata]|nr:hypothetical protein B0H14DRAFT_2619391 [Mycena olivaceomarginata]